MSRSLRRALCVLALAAVPVAGAGADLNGDGRVRFDDLLGFVRHYAADGIDDAGLNP